jgi:hypothetical protein
MYAALKSAFEDIRIFGKNGGADRRLYAQFLDEASLLFSNPDFGEISTQFRKSADAWDDLAISLLPDEIPLLKETRVLMLQKHQLFLKQGSSALEEMRVLKDRISDLRSSADKEFPINEAQAEDLHFKIADKVETVRDIEVQAIEDLTLALDS